MAGPAKQDPSVPANFQRIAEHYHVQRRLGEGAFGEVYLARHDLLGQDFAIKVLKPELCEDESLRQRFLDEARALIRFSHPNVVQMRHVGEHEGRLYLVMDFVGGKPLSDLIQKEGPLDEGRATHLMLQVLAGLEAAHAAGIIHRDLKPSNMLVERRDDGQERVRILDFGLSKLSGVDAHRSVSGTVVGTLAYMSPEQLQGERSLDGRSDVFAAGLIFMEMLQGHHPYPGESGIVVAAKLLRDPVPPLDAKRAARISPAARTALARALERDRDARFPSAVAFAQALLGHGPPSDTSKVTTIEEARRELARQEAVRRDAESAARGRRGKALVLGGLVVLLAGAGAWYTLGHRGNGGDGPSGPGTIAGGIPPTPPPVEPAAPPPPGPRPPPTPPVEGPGDPRPPEPPPPEPAPPQPPEPQPPPPEPARPGPTPAEPAAPTPGPAEPTPSPEPTPPPPESPTPHPEPAAPPRPPEPEPATPARPEPAPPEPPPPEAPGTPAEVRAKAAEADATGAYAAARALYAKALEADAFDEAALWGVAGAWLREADATARRGDPTVAMSTLDEALAWLKARYAAYEKQSVTGDPEAVRIASGLSRTFLAETQTERARWLALLGDATGAAAARQQATDHFRFANQFLNRDSVRYWEMLLRRAKLATLEARLDVAVEDLAITTATNNVEVPAHMWVAHGVGIRRQAEAAMAKSDLATARKRAAAALDVVKRGAAWQRARFTRDHYLEAARVVLVSVLVAEGEAERRPLQALMQYYVDEAAKHEPRRDEAPERTASRLAAARAGKHVADGLLLKDQGKAGESRGALEAAVAEAEEAVRQDEALAEKLGPLPSSFPHVVLGYARHYLGDAAGSQKALQAARAAAARNPE